MNKEVKEQIKLQRFVYMAGQGEGLGRTEALQKLHLKAKEFDRLVEEAVEQGLMRVYLVGGKTKPAMLYKATIKQLLPTAKVDITESVLSEEFKAARSNKVMSSYLSEDEIEKFNRGQEKAV